MGVTTTAEESLVSRGDRVALRLTGAIAVVVALLALVGVAVGASAVLGDATLEVRGMPIANATTPEFTAPLAPVRAASYETVAVTVEDPPTAARVLLLASSAASTLVVIGVSLAVAWLCVRVLRRRPFGRSVTAAAAASAIVVLVGALAADVLGALGRGEVVAFLGADATAGSSDSEPAREGFLALGLQIDLAPVGIAVALAVVALVCRLGDRMQRDTVGLV